MRRTSRAAPFRTPGAAAAALACAAVAASVSLGGCADYARAARLSPGPLNVESPAAGAVAQVERMRLPQPSFRDVPPAVYDLRPASIYGRDVADLRGQRSGLLDWERANPAEVDDTQNFARTRRAGLAAEAPGAPPPDQAQRTADWAKAVRDAAKPPPPKPPS